MSSNALDLSTNRREAMQLSPEYEWFDIDADPAGWNELARNGGQGMFHLSPLLRAHAHGNAHPRGIVLRRSGDGPIAIGGLMRSAGGRRSFEMLSFPPLQATGDRQLVGSLVQWLFAQDVAEVRIGSFTSGVEGYHVPVEASTRERLEFVWDVRTPSEQRFRALRSNHKRKLQKLLKQEFVLKRIANWQPERMTWLRVQWARRREIGLSPRQVLDMYRYHRLLHQCLTRSGVGHLYGIYSDDGILLSAAYMLEADDMAFYMIGASSPAGYQRNASLRLFWDLAELYCSRGFSCLHFGGAPGGAVSPSHEEHGVMRFKAGFGIEPISRISLYTRK